MGERPRNGDEKTKLASSKSLLDVPQHQLDFMPRNIPQASYTMLSMMFLSLGFGVVVAVISLAWSCSIRYSPFSQ